MNNHSKLLRYVGDKSVQILTDLTITIRSPGGAQASAPRFLFEDGDLHHVEVRGLAAGELIESQTICRDSLQETTGGLVRVCSQLPDFDPQHLRVLAPVSVNVYQKGRKLFLEGYCDAECFGAMEAPVISVFDRERPVQEIHLGGLVPRCMQEKWKRMKDKKREKKENEKKIAKDLLEIAAEICTKLKTQKFDEIEDSLYTDFMAKVKDVKISLLRFDPIELSKAFLAVLSWAEINLKLIDEDDKTKKKMKQLSEKLEQSLLHEYSVEYLLNDKERKPEDLPLKGKAYVFASVIVQLTKYILAQLETMKLAITEKVKFSEDELNIPAIKNISTQ